MGKKERPSDSRKPDVKLNLEALLVFSPDSSDKAPLCRKLLGEMYGAVFGDLSPGSASRIRNGKGSDTSYENGLRYLQEHPGVRDHILEVWKKWQPYPHRSSFMTRMLDILSEPTLADAGTPEQADELKLWLRRRIESDDAHEQAELMTTLTLLACTIGHWQEAAQLCLPKYHAVPSDGPSSHETELLEQIHTAEGRRDLEEVIRLLERLIKDPLCRSSNLGAYYYRLSMALEQFREQTEEPELRKQRGERARQALCAACKYDHPEALLRAAKQAQSLRMLTECYRYCEMAVRAGGNTQAGAEACWLLYQLGKGRNAPTQWQKVAGDYLKLASQKGYPEAVKKYREEHAVTLSDQLPRSEDTTTGIFCVNADNDLTRILTATNPKSWLLLSDSMTEAPRDQLARKYFFLDDDHGRNLSQALRLLQSIKNSGAEQNDIAIYLRAPEEQAAPLIDTALACMDEAVVPVRILDDDRLAARVLGYHPLYYPIRYLPADAGAELNFVVIGDNRCCEWLVREAFWMTTFRNRQITTKITLLAPHAEALFDRLMQHCPAMAAAGKQPNVRSGDPLTRDFPYIRAVDCGYESKEFHNKMAELMAARNLYIAVDAGSDLQNMGLATSLRESAIRAAVRSGSIRSDSMPTITFHCSDTDIASLSRRTVVLNENSGSQWYNNYNLIPFGVAGELYSWDALTRDLVEELSLDVHMVYCGIDPKEDRGKRQWSDAVNSYLQRSYNRDSSVAVALSLGYRLYQCNYYGAGPVLPDFWDIPDRDAIFSNRALKQLAEKLGDGPKKDDVGRWSDRSGNTHTEVFDGSCVKETQLLAEWEHDRWNRFMISRGWMPATIGQMQTYRDAGNLRQQLYIGRLHPYICPYDDLKKLEHELGREIRKYDFQNIRRTGPILNREWTQPQRTLERIRERTDRERAR